MEFVFSRTFLLSDRKEIIPIDLAISKKGIFLPSKCQCYHSLPNREHNTHLFLNSEIGAAVWSFYANLLDINTDVLTIQHMLSKWWTKSKGSSLYSWILRVLPCLIIWNLWKARNKARFDDPFILFFSLSLTASMPGKLSVKKTPL